MIKSCIVAAMLAAAVAGAGSAVALAQAPPASPPSPLRLGLGDLMTMLVQPRHTKLGLGGQARNWDYVAYELHELEEAFERIERASPRYRTFSVTEMLGLTKEPMAALETAIKARDAARFDAAYQQLTDSCNACHRGMDKAMVVIQFPKLSPFPDQNFTAQKP